MQEAQSVRASRGARLRVLSGNLWVTREGDLADHVLLPGQSVPVARGDRLWLGAWQRDQPALWDWAPQAAPRYAFLRATVALAFGFAARALRGAAAALGDLARSAAAIASRAQGCIKPSDSIASAGTLQ
jgi:hypothetical protein